MGEDAGIPDKKGGCRMKVGRSCMGGGYIIASIYMYSSDLMRQPVYRRFCRNKTEHLVEKSEMGFSEVNSLCYNATANKVEPGEPDALKKP